jgi:hypothetical protein
MSAKPYYGVFPAQFFTRNGELFWSFIEKANFCLQKLLYFDKLLKDERLIRKV